MRRVMFVLLAVSCLFLTFGCGPKTSMIKGGESYASMEGFIDDDTLQVKALGFPKAGIDAPLQMRYTAKRAAQVNAQAVVVEKLLGANLTGKTATEDGALLGEVIKKDFEGMIKGGVTIQETYDKDTNACEIIYQVKEKGLKKKAEGGMGKVK